MKRLLTRLFTLPRWISFPTVVAALVGVTAVSYPGGLSAAYADLRDAGRLSESLEASRTTQRKLCERLLDVRDRVEYKEELISALIDGHTTLTKVTDEFVELNRGDVNCQSLQQLRYGHLSETELAAVNVLDYVRSRAGDDSGSSVVWSRLQGEFRRRFGHPAPKL